MTVTNPIECPYYLISRVTLVVTSALKRGFAEAGVEQVKPAYLGVLLSLWQEDGLQVARLGRRAGLEPSTMTGLLDRMERDGLAKRVADPRDRRAQRICLTTEGRNIQDTVTLVVDRILSNVFEGIPAEQIKAAKDILRQVLANTHKG